MASRRNTSKVDEGVNNTPSKPTNTIDTAMQEMAVTAALKASIETSSELAIRKAEREYINGKKKHMLNRCKNDTVVKFVGNKIYAPYFGETYTFLYNTIPVTVKFDGSTQEFPKFIYDMIQKKIQAVSELSVPKEEIEDRS